MRVLLYVAAAVFSLIMSKFLLWTGLLSSCQAFTVHRNAQHPSQVFRKNLCLIITPFSTSRPVQRDRYDHIRVPSPDFFLKIFHEFLTVQFPVSSLIVVFELIDRLIHRSFMVP